VLRHVSGIGLEIPPGVTPPAPAPSYQFPAWDEARANSTGFINYLNFILQFASPVASEAAVMERR
jgi:hypothetical protein